MLRSRLSLAPFCKTAGTWVTNPDELRLRNGLQNRNGPLPRGWLLYVGLGAFIRLIRQFELF